MPGQHTEISIDQTFVTIQKAVDLYITLRIQYTFYHTTHGSI